MELSSEVPGTNLDWPSDITLWVNEIAVGTWTSPGDYGDQRGVYTPDWWKLEGSQYGKLKTWRIGRERHVHRRRALFRREHRRCRPSQSPARSGCGSASTRRPSTRAASNIFGKGFGNYSHDIIMRLQLQDQRKK